MKSLRLLACILICLLVATSRSPTATAHDLPDRDLDARLREAEGERLHLLVRVPLVLLANLGLPRREAGYLDLRRMDAPLERAAAATAKEFEIREDGESACPRSVDPARHAAIGPFVRVLRAGARADRRTAAACDVRRPLEPGLLRRAPRVPDRARSAATSFSRVTRSARSASGSTVDVRFLPPGGDERIYLLRGSAARWRSTRAGSRRRGSFAEVRRPPHPRRPRPSALPAVPRAPVPPARLEPRRRHHRVHAWPTSITLSAAAYGCVPAGEWFPPLVETLIAASIIYMAVENLLAPNLCGAGWSPAIFGLVHGFGFSFALSEELQFAGEPSRAVAPRVQRRHRDRADPLRRGAAAAPRLACALAARVALHVARRLRRRSRSSPGYWLVERAQALARWPVADADLAMGAAQVLSVLLILGGLACWIVGRRAAIRQRAGGSR